MPKLLFFAGSCRRASWNQQLAKFAAERAHQHGAEAQWIDLADYEMPLFNEDLEATMGMPATTVQLRQQIHEADGLFIASPEYNASVTPLLKNTIDWLTRPAPGSDAGQPFAEKAIALGAASPGGLGGLRGLMHLRDILINLGAYLVPSARAIGSADEAFDDRGQLVREADREALDGILQSLIRLAETPRNR